MLPTPAEKLQNFFGVFLQFHIGVDTPMLGNVAHIKQAAPSAQMEGTGMAQISAVVMVW